MAGDNICAICDQPAHGFRACQSHVMPARIEKLKVRLAALLGALKKYHEEYVNHRDNKQTKGCCACEAITQAEEKS